MLRLLGPLIPYLAVVGATAVPVAFVAHNNGYASAQKEHERQYQRWWVDHVLLWSTINDLNHRAAEMAGQWESVLDATDEARRQFRRSLNEYRQEAEEGRATARRALELLDHIENEWTAMPVSPDVVCVRDDRTGCDNADDTSGSNNGDDLRELASADGS